MITLTYHRLHHSTCQRRRNLHDLFDRSCSISYDDDDQHVNIIAREARHLFLYLNRTLNETLARNEIISSTIKPTNIDSSTLETTRKIPAATYTTKTTTTATTTTTRTTTTPHTTTTTTTTTPRNLNIPINDRSQEEKSSPLSHEKLVETTTLEQVVHSASFPNLLDFWKFLLKIFLLTIILLIGTYLIIRTLLWVIETILRPNGNNPGGN